MQQQRSLPRLTSAEASARLGVKPATLYAYVARGLLDRERTPAGSTFDPLDVEVFARSRRAAPDAAEVRGGAPLMVLDTGIANIRDGDLYFRDRSAAGLAATEAFEDVVAWLWDVPSVAVSVPSASIARARRAVATLDADASVVDRIVVAVRALRVSAPLRTGGAQLLRAVPLVLARSGAGPAVGAGAGAGSAVAPDAPVAALLWSAFADRSASPEDLRALDAALVLLVDHDLAVSTFAARVAASARGSATAVVTAALGAFDTPLHGGASAAAARALRRVVAGASPRETLGAAVVDVGRGVPGFGHPLYSGADPRATALLAAVARMPAAGPVLDAVEALAGEARTRTGLHPNVDLALAALAVAGGMRDDAGVAVFAVSRIAGWIAHALAEEGERPMRLRPRGRYAGP